jgi:hypothetical protein
MVTVARTFCGLAADSAALGDVGAAAGHDLDQALTGQHPDGLAVTGR